MILEHFKPLLVDTVQKEYRSKTLVFLFFLTIAIIFFINAGINIILEFVKDADILNFASKKTSLFLFVISSWTSLLSIFFGSGCINSDAESGIVSQFLSFPISRVNYLLSRVFGTFLIVISYYSFSLLMAYIIFSFSNHPLEINILHLGALINISIVILSLITLSAFISLYMSRVVGFLVTVVFYILLSICNSYFFGLEFVKHFTDLSIMKILGIAIYYLLPRIGVFSSYTNNILLDSGDVNNYGLNLAHFFISYTILFFIFFKFFQKKEN